MRPPRPALTTAVCSERDQSTPIGLCVQSGSAATRSVPAWAMAPLKLRNERKPRAYA